jgi:aspartate 1-decarboxylase
MERILLKSKIHRATVTDAELHYEGSISIDPDLLAAANIAEFEQVQVYNITNGNRFTTYAIRADGAGEIKVNGAAAHLATAGDQVIIASYANYTPEEAARHRPLLVKVDERNRMTATHREIVTPGSAGRAQGRDGGRPGRQGAVTP